MYMGTGIQTIFLLFRCAPETESHVTPFIVYRFVLDINIIF